MARVATTAPGLINISQFDAVVIEREAFLFFIPMVQILTEVGIIIPVKEIEPSYFISRMCHTSSRERLPHDFGNLLGKK